MSLDWVTRSPKASASRVEWTTDENKRTTSGRGLLETVVLVRVVREAGGALHAVAHALGLEAGVEPAVVVGTVGVVALLLRVSVCSLYFRLFITAARSYDGGPYDGMGADW